MALPRLQNALVRISDSTLYSSIIIDNTQGTLSNGERNFFSYGAGSAGPGYATASRITETNLRTAGQVPSQQSFLARGISLQFSNFTSKAPLSSADLHNLIDSSVLQWNFQSTRIEIAPASMIGSAGGVFGVAGTAGGVASEIGSGAGGYYHFARPVTLYPLATFGILWTFPTSAVAQVVSTVIKCTLIGNLQVDVDAG